MLADLIQKNQGIKNEDYIDSLDSLADLYYKKGSLSKSAKIYEQALKIGAQNINLNERNCLIKFNYEIFGLTNIIKPLIKLDSKFTNNNIRIYGDLNIQELNVILTKILDLKSNLISN